MVEKSTIFSVTTTRTCWNTACGAAVTTAMLINDDKLRAQVNILKMTVIMMMMML